MEVELRMFIFTENGFTKIFGPLTLACRSIGSQLAYYVDKSNAEDFFADSLEVYPVRCMTSDEQLGILFYVDNPPQDYRGKPYKVYKLKRPYKLIDGTDKLTHSYYVPIPSIMVRDLDLGKGMSKLISVKGGFLKDGQKVILIQKRRGPTN